VPPPIWTENFKVHSYEVDFKRAATLEKVCRYFQEAAWNHAEALGVGFERLAAEQKLWVLSRLLMNVERYPLWGETIEAQTWPRSVEGPFAMRDFEFFDSGGRRLMGGTSAWLVLAGSSRRPQRVDNLVAALPHHPERRATDRSPQKLAPESGAANSDREARQVEVRYSDLDVNHHANNSRYLGWLLDCYPREFHQENQVSSCELNYLGETGAGDQLRVESRPDGRGLFSHEITNQAGATVCRGRLSWAPLSR
jgi:medium-chain acyl-[acyl-carrier-protein] hydrolase